MDPTYKGLWSLAVRRKSDLVESVALRWTFGDDVGCVLTATLGEDDGVEGRGLAPGTIQTVNRGVQLSAINSRMPTRSR
jgi:hypothetical protein